MKRKVRRKNDPCPVSKKEAEAWRAVRKDVERGKAFWCPVCNVLTRRPSGYCRAHQEMSPAYAEEEAERARIAAEEEAARLAAIFPSQGFGAIGGKKPTVTPKGHHRCEKCNRLVRDGRECGCGKAERVNSKVKVTERNGRVYYTVAGEFCNHRRCAECGKDVTDWTVSKSIYCPKCRKANRTGNAS